MTMLAAKVFAFSICPTIVHAAKFKIAVPMAIVLKIFFIKRFSLLFV
jgi:hypothetical protein